MKDNKEKHYRPLPEYLTVKESPILSEKTGESELGLFATKDIPKCTVLGTTHLQLNGHKNWMRTPLGAFYNHNSTEANCESYFEPWYDEEDLDKVIGTKKKIRVISNIRSGQEILAKYTLYNPEKDGE